MKLSTLYWYGAGLVAVLVFLVLVGSLDIARAVGGFFIGGGCLFMAHTQRVMARWIAVKGKVVNVTKGEHTTITYSYIAGQTPHSGTAASETHRLGQELDVYYNPKNPAESAVFSWLSILLPSAPILLGFLMLVLGPQLGR